MRIALAASLLKSISSTSTGGTEAFSYNLAEGLVRQNIDTTLFATSDSKTKAKLVSVCSSKQTTGVYEGNVELRMPYQLLQTSEILKREQEFDIIHNNYFGFYAMTAFSPFTSLPIVTTMHNHFWHYPNLRSILTRTQRRGKDVVVFASQAARNLAGDLFDAEVIYHGINMEQFPFSSSPKEYFLFFSRQVPGKGIKDAMEAARQGNFKLVVAGGAAIFEEDMTFIKKEIEPYFSHTIRNEGTPNNKKRLALYQKSKALILPTHLDEQFGIVAAESMSCGTPVIAYNRGALSEVVKDGVTGFIIDPDDEERPGKGTWIIKKQGIDGIIEAMKRINEIDRAACRKHVEKHFTTKRMINEYVTLYKKLLNK